MRCQGTGDAIQSERLKHRSYKTARERVRFAAALSAAAYCAMVDLFDPRIISSPLKLTASEIARS